MKAWTSLALGGLLLAACSNEKKPAETAYDPPAREHSDMTMATGTTAEARPIEETQPSSVQGSGTSGGVERAEIGSSGTNGANGANGAPATLPAASTDEGHRGAGTPGTTATTDPPRGAGSVDADNTKVNRRDRDQANLTPMDQGNSDGDRHITAEIRKAVVGDGSLSFTAKNVKIITKDGNVVLRGPVKSEAERSSILAKATRVAGAGRVTNQLEIAK